MIESQFKVANSVENGIIISMKHGRKFVYFGVLAVSIMSLLACSFGTEGQNWQSPEFVTRTPPPSLCDGGTPIQGLPMIGVAKDGTLELAIEWNYPVPGGVGYPVYVIDDIERKTPGIWFTSTIHTDGSVPSPEREFCIDDDKRNFERKPHFADVRITEPKIKTRPLRGER